MDQAKHDLVSRVAAFQIAINAMSPGAPKTSMQGELSALILALVDVEACGPLRVGNEAAGSKLRRDDVAAIRCERGAAPEHAAHA